MKKAAIVVVAAVAALAVTGSAGARATYETDLSFPEFSPFKNGEVVIHGGVFSEKGKCRGGRELELFNFTPPMKRRGAPEPLDTTTSSKGGGYAFLVDANDLTEEAVKVKAKETTKGGDTCKKASEYEFVPPFR